MATKVFPGPLVKMTFATSVHAGAERLEVCSILWALEGLGVVKEISSLSPFTLMLVAVMLVIMGPPPPRSVKWP